MQLSHRSWRLVQCNTHHLLKALYCPANSVHYKEPIKVLLPWATQVKLALLIEAKLVALVLFFCRLAEALKPGNAAYIQKCANWLLTMSEAVLSAYTHAMNSCQAAGPLAALKLDYERARNGYLHRLLDIAADLGEVWLGVPLA